MQFRIQRLRTAIKNVFAGSLRAFVVTVDVKKLIPVNGLPPAKTAIIFGDSSGAFCRMNSIALFFTPAIAAVHTTDL